MVNVASWKNSMFTLGRFSLVSKLFLNSEIKFKVQTLLYWVAQWISATLIQFPSTLFQWLEWLFRLWVLAACSQDCCFLLPGAKSCWFCSFFCRIAPFLPEPQGCICGVGHVLVKKPAANKCSFWWLVVRTKSLSQGGAVCDRIFYASETIFCIWSNGILPGYLYPI